MKTFGIEASSLLQKEPGGISWYTRSLCEALRDLPRSGKDFQLELLYKLSRFNKRKYGIFPDGLEHRWHLGQVLPLKKYDLLHSPDTVFLHRKGVKTILTVHDLAIFKEENNIAGYTNEAFKDRIKAYLDKTTGRADGIITVSDSTRRDLEEMYPGTKGKIRTIYLGPKLWRKSQGHMKQLSEYGLEDKRYLLFAGLISIRKNIPGLLGGFKRSGLEKEYKLVLAGGEGPGFSLIRETVSRLGLESSVVFTGYRSENELSLLYDGAKAFMFPTYYEGFGLPVIEAMGKGIPVLTSKNGATREISGGLAVYCDPHDQDSIAKGIAEVVMTKEELIPKLKEWARGFSWDKCAAETLAFYEEVLSA